jgi:prepilin-type processing-associated H-X9-DG protein
MKRDFFMKKLILILSAAGLSLGLPFPAAAKPMAMADGANTLTIGEIHYDGQLSDDQAHFTLNLDAEATGESSAPLLQGEVALLPARLPDGLEIIRRHDQYVLTAARAGHFKVRLEVIAKIQRTEPWNQVSFTGPAATIAAVTAQAAGADTEVQLLSGTLQDAATTNGVSRLTGYLAADQVVALRWRAKVAAVAHQALLTVDSTITTHITATVVKYTNKFHYDIIQGSVAELTLTLPVAQTLTHLDGEQIRDWHLSAAGDHQTLTIEFIKPVENSCDVILYTEQTVDGFDERLSVNPPQPLNVERESGSLTVSVEDLLADIDAPTALHQVNAPDDALAAYEYHARPVALSLKLKPIEPVMAVTDRMTAQLEETRLVVACGLQLDVKKAGIYSMELTPPGGFAVADVRGNGIEDWNVSQGKIHVNFSTRVLGAYRLDVQLEQALKTFPDRINLAPLRVTGAAEESAQIGAASAPGIQLRTGTLAGLREIPVDRLPDRGGEILAYTAEQPDWTLSIASERLAARVVADVFNLVTVGEGSVGGSATIRYSLANQGVQEFKVRVPAAFKNVEFTGPDIRRKEQAGDVWTIGLQDKAWGGYTLVITYDYPFDAQGATLPVGGIHALNVERETGSLAVTTAASLQLEPGTVSDSLRRIDETELSAADRSVITRAVVLAYQYTGGDYDLSVAAKQFASVPVLEAVADRTQITSVLTGAGEMLTQASFMVKNNEKQFQRFELPASANLWGCYVNGQPAKPERDGDGVLVPLPRGADRDQVFAVDILYAQTNGALAGALGQTIAFAAPRTDVPNTYAEWQLFVPPAFRLSDFGGSMNVAEGTTYELFDAWEKFLAFYGQVLREAGGAIFVIGSLALLVIMLVIAAARRGWSGVITLFFTMMILAVLGAMLLPALASAKRKAQRISSVNNLKQVGLGAMLFSGDNNGRLPRTLDEMHDELGTDKITFDVETGQRFTYLGDGMPLNQLKSDSVLAFSPIINGGCNVLFADGSVSQLTAGGFAELSQRGLVQLATPTEKSADQSEVFAETAPAAPRVLAQAVAAPPPESLSATFNPASGLPSAAPETATANGAVATDSGNSSGIAGSASGGGGGSGSVGNLSPTAPTVAGLRSIRIELPESGQPFLFTKVLNLRDEPLSIRAHIMPLRTFLNLQMAWQTGVFLIGLLLWWRQWSRPNRGSFVLTIALALMLGSVCSLLVQWRALHDALIVGFPVAALAIIAIVIWKYLRRDREETEEAFATSPPVPPSDPTLPPETGLPPVAAAIILVLALSLTGASAAQPIDAQAAGASVVSAAYSGTVNDRVAEVDATLRFSPTQVGRTIPLFGDDVAVQAFTVQSGRAELVLADGRLAVKINRGDVTLHLRMLVKITGDVTKRQLAFGIPAALSSQVSLVLDEPGAEVDFPTAISFQRTPEPDRTRVTAVIGPADQLELVWTPHVKRAEETAATLFCQNAALVTFGGGVMNVHTILDYQISQGELRQARVRLPFGQHLLRVEGDGIRTWETKMDPLVQQGGQILVVDLLKGVSSSWRLTVETEENLVALPAREDVAVPHALDVKRETGLIALRSNGEVGLSVESADGLQRVDADEFASAFPEKLSGKTDGLLSVFQFSKPEFTLRERVEAVQPEIEAVVRNHFHVSPGQLSLAATVDYVIKRAGVFTLTLALPEGWDVEQVAGNNLEQQNERTEDGRRLLEVTLKDRTSGAYTLNLILTRDFKELPKSLALAGVYPLHTAKLVGYVGVTTEPGVVAKTDSFDGLTEIPAVSLPDYANLAGNGSVLAYKFISSEPDSTPGWSLSLATETVAAWVRAEIVNTLSLTETLVSGHALIRYDIANAPVKELRVRVPDNFQNVEITGPNIRSREQAGNVWRVELQSPIRGQYTLAVTWEQSWEPSNSPATNGLPIAGVSAEGVERETGLLAISAQPPLQVGAAAVTDLQGADTGDFPEWAGTPDPATALVYRYVRPDYKLALKVRRLDEAEVLQAIVEKAQFTTVVADDGQMMTKMSLSLQSNGRQFLEVELPAGDSVWSAFVGGQPVRPSLRAGKLLLPIEQSAADDGATSVELTYIGADTFPRRRGEVGFISPKFDVPLKNARWEMYLPPNYDYDHFQGTMTRELAAAPESATTSFSILDYSRMEQVGKSAVQTEARHDVEEARAQLAGGNVHEASVSFNRARDQLDAGGHLADRDVLQLQKDLQNAQASNLIAAQNDFTFRNSGQIAGQSSGPGLRQYVGQYFTAGSDQQTASTPPASVGAQYDDIAAGEQWTKLQQAQEIAAVKVQPLHVNLPVRGLHFAFTQVLQTETGKPMTVQLFAASSKAVNWPLRGLTLAGAFLLLWGLVAALTRLTSGAKA